MPVCYWYGLEYIYQDSIYHSMVDEKRVYKDDLYISKRYLLEAKRGILFPVFHIYLLMRALVNIYG